MLVRALIAVPLLLALVVLTPHIGGAWDGLIYTVYIVALAAWVRRAARPAG